MSKVSTGNVSHGGVLLDDPIGSKIYLDAEFFKKSWFTIDGVVHKDFKIVCTAKLTSQGKVIYNMDSNG